MGLIRKAKETFSRKETPLKTYKKAKDLEFKQELYEAKQKGRRSEALKLAEQEGRKSVHGGGGFTGLATSLQGSLNNTEKAFGFNNVGNIGSGLDFGFGGMGGSEPKRAPPMRERRILPNGTVVIKEPVVAAKKKQRQASPYNWMDEVGKNNFLE
jgi:hypothetical protein